MCAQVGIRTTPGILARSRGQTLALCAECASQGAADAWEEREVIDGAIPGADPVGGPGRRRTRIELYWDPRCPGWYGALWLREWEEGRPCWSLVTDTRKMGEPDLEGYTLEERAAVEELLAQAWGDYDEE